MTADDPAASPAVADLRDRVQSAESADRAAAAWGLGTVIANSNARPLADVLVARIDAPPVGLDRRKRDAIESLVAFAGQLREAYVAGELTTPITTRELVRIATFMEDDFMDLETATESELLARVDDHDTSLVATLLEKSL
ncbi:CbbQ/NirQ/NorQ domain-containing protein [Halorubellus salinus]|uniref:CbbQ/NirQ/NorQ domain-containing protein n=1 Tax=Halorubellus salinus TaxID=755309 RepID=UPI001D064E29